VNLNPLLEYLEYNSYAIVTVMGGELHKIGDYEENKYVELSFKGKINVEQGGISLLWERQTNEWENQKSQKKSMWIAILSAIIALSALIANILFSYFKDNN
jgi:hypothetical protein